MFSTYCSYTARIPFTSAGGYYCRVIYLSRLLLLLRSSKQQQEPTPDKSLERNPDPQLLLQQQLLLWSNSKTLLR
jgi:hypothetical protein